MPVKNVDVKHIAPGTWTADITFGIPDDGSHDDPTITLNSSEGVELLPKSATSCSSGRLRLLVMRTTKLTERRSRTAILTKYHRRFRAAPC